MLGNLQRTLVLLVMVVPALADLQEATDAWRSDDSEKALAQIQPHLETVDDDSRPWHELYQDIHMAQKRESELLAEYQEHLKKTPTPEAHYLLARVTADFTERERLLQAGLALAPEHAFLRREWARCVFRLGRKAEAKEAWRAMMEVMPEELEVYASYFETMERLGEAEEGMEHFREWAQEHPNKAFFQAMAYRCLQKRSPEEAKGYLEKAIALDANSELVLTVRSEAAFRLRQMAVAKELLEALERNPSSDRWMIRSGKFDAMVHQRIPEGLEKLSRYVRLHPLEPMGWSALATVCLATNDIDRAKIASERALKWHPSHTEALFARGYVALQEERFTDAMVALEKSLEIDPDSVNTLRNLAACYRQVGKHTQAQEALRKAKALASEPDASNELRIDREDTGELIIKDPAIVRAEGLCAFGVSLAREGKLEEARENFRQASELAPSLVKAHQRLAVIEQMGFQNLEGAIKHWEKAREVHSPEGSVQALGNTVERLALAYHHQGKRKKAWETLDAYVRDHEQVLGTDSDHAKLRDAFSKSEAPTKVVRLENIAAAHCAEDDYCLSQSIATVLNYWKLPNDVEEIGNFIGEKKHAATALAYLDTRSADLGYRCFTPKLEVVKALIQQGFPVMLLGQFLSNGEYYGGHATVMVGYDETLARVLIEDANWFQGLDSLPFAALQDLRGIVIAPNARLASLEIALPDKAYHDKLIAFEPLIEDKSADIDKAEVKAMVALEPNHWWGHVIQAKVYQRQKDTFGAEIALTKAVETSSQSALPHLMLAKIFIDDDSIAEASAWLRRALEREPNLHFARKQLIAQLFDPERKLESFKTRFSYVISKDRGDTHNLKEALLQCERYLSEHRDDLDFMLVQVVCELKLRLFTDAEETARTLVRRSSNAKMSLWLALSLRLQDKHPEALACLDTAIQQASDEATKAYLMRWKQSISEDAKP